MLCRPFGKRPRPMSRHYAPGRPAPRDDREGEAAADEIFPIVRETQILLIPAMAAMLRAGHVHEYGSGSHRFLEGFQLRHRATSTIDSPMANDCADEKFHIGVGVHPCENSRQWLKG
jgi:hypothetical protein